MSSTQQQNLRFQICFRYNDEISNEEMYWANNGTPFDNILLIPRNPELAEKFRSQPLPLVYPSHEDMLKEWLPLPGERETKADNGNLTFRTLDGFLHHEYKPAFEKLNISDIEDGKEFHIKGKRIDPKEFWELIKDTEHAGAFFAEFFSAIKDNELNS